MWGSSEAAFVYKSHVSGALDRVNSIVRSERFGTLSLEDQQDFKAAKNLLESCEYILDQIEDRNKCKC